MTDLQQPDSGWHLVPQKLTAKMASLLQWCERGSPDQLQEAWRQLLDAAPQPAQELVSWPAGSAQLHTSLLDMGKAMAKERSREIGDAWNQLADLLYLLSKARNTPQAPQPAHQKRVARTDQQIVDQTEELAVWLLSWGFNHRPETQTPMRESAHPFAERCWEAACRIQEMLTDTDPENSVAELDVAPDDGSALAAPQPAQVSAALAEATAQVRAINAHLDSVLAAPQPAPDWSQIGKITEAAAHAAAGRYVTGTTNWAAAVSRYMLAAAPQPSALKLSSDGAAAVNPETFWIPITKENMPIEGARYLLINRSAGMTQVAPFKNDGWYTHYAGMPKFKD